MQRGSFVVKRVSFLAAVQAGKQATLAAATFDEVLGVTLFSGEKDDKVKEEVQKATPYISVSGCSGSCALPLACMVGSKLRLECLQSKIDVYGRMA
jgi:hypothetical protein